MIVPASTPGIEDQLPADQEAPIANRGNGGSRGRGRGMSRGGRTMSNIPEGKEKGKA